MFYPDELDQIFCGTVQTFTPWDYKVCICIRAFSLIGRYTIDYCSCIIPNSPLLHLHSSFSMLIPHG